ncbi:MAG TPA: class II glutamine amidotransferase [Kofleriaceae bacterium]|nr:class II glutamine amidotransferase [Kofleriaceae bacterium]
MCRMFGLLSARPVSPRVLLRDAPRSLWTLAREHRDGWGVAIDEPGGWQLHRDTACAQASPRFDDVADTVRGRVVVAHIRQKTVGETALANTHPFRRGPLVFAHNGTVTDPAALAAATSAERRAEVAGETDSERLFAFVASAIDRAGDLERGVALAVRALHEGPALGSLSFLLACGERIFAHRLGRALHLLVRSADEPRGPERARAVDEDPGCSAARVGSEVWLPVAPPARQPAGVPSKVLVVASEPLTDEAWRELPERSLHVLENGAGGPSVRALV